MRPVRAEDILAGLPTPRPGCLGRALLSLEALWGWIVQACAWLLVEVVALFRRDR